MKFKIIFLAAFLLFFFLSPFKAFAASEFGTSYDVTYEVGKDGVTLVTQKINLKNLTSQYYASNFTLTIGSTTVSDITASDIDGPMESKVESKDGKTSITVNFNQQVVGQDKSQVFTLKFKSKDFAQSIGKTWEVNLPKIPSSTNLENYTLVLSVPISFGDPTSISPNPKSQSQTFDKQIFTYTKDQLISSGVSVNFGTSQVFDFNIKYDLENTSLFPVITYVTLPPDTAYQDVMINRLDPQPINVTIDEDGNFLAWYRLGRSSKQTVNVIGSAKLYISSREERNKENSTSPSLSKEQIIELTKADQYWERDNPTISAALSHIFKDGTPSSSKDKAKMIYRYVVDTLKYSNERLNQSDIERLGAVTVLNNPQSAVCMEFTDLFIALTRAAGIPARELDGFAYSQNPVLRPLSLSRDLLHAWPEYFDEQKGWVMVDPTWENTSGGVDYFNKFDLNHMVLAIKGKSSKSPYSSDNVKVFIAEGDFLGKPQLIVDLDVPDSILAGFPTNLTVKVSNQGNSAQGSSILSLSTEKINVVEAKELGLGSIPAFGFTTQVFSLRTPFTWNEFEEEIKVNINGQDYTKKVVVKPFFLFQPIPYIFGGIAATFVIVYGLILFLHLKQRPKKA